METLETPLTRQMTAFGRVLSVIILGMAVAMVLIGWFLHSFGVEELMMATTPAPPAPSGLRVGLWFTNRVVWIAVGVLVLLQLLFVYAPRLNRWFHTAPLAASDWLLPVGIGVVIFLVVEMEKAVVRWVAPPRGPRPSA